VSFGNFLIKQVAEDLGRELRRLDTFTTLSPVPDFRAWLKRQNTTVDAGDEEQLLRLCAAYLLRAKRPDGAPLDPVARFHLANGARLERINWHGDTSSA